MAYRAPAPAGPKAHFDYNFKYIVIGPSGVGKSCLLLQFTDRKFVDHHELTVGVEFGIRAIRVEDKSVKLQIWDTAGQESFRSITNSYYRGSHGALLVYDITRRESFKFMRSWLDEIRAAAPTVVIVLVGNKCDLEGQREVKREEGEKFALDNDLLFMETSAKTSHNVEAAFQRSAELVFDQIQRGLVTVEEDPATTKLRPTEQPQTGCCNGGQ